MISIAEYVGGAAHEQLEPATMLDYALDYAARGLRVLPLRPKGKAPLGALVPNGKDDATCDAEAIKAWWRAVPDANIGINCAASGIVVVDIDRHEGKANGFETLSALETENGPLRSSVVAKSGSGGEHRYYREPGGAHLPGKAGPGIDLKHNGYIVAPPSIHPNGEPYEWLPGCSPFDAQQMPLLPEWVCAPRIEPVNSPINDSKRPPNEAARACYALFSLGAGCDRPTWVRIAMAAKDAGVPYDVFHAWSANGANYTGEDDCRSVWDSFKGNKAVPVTAATLFYEAQKAGWHDPAKARDSHEADPQRYRVLSADDLLNAPPLRWLVRGVLPASGLAALYGPSGSGKSFLALDLCAAVAEGSEWFGRRVDAAPVMYVCLEGEAGMGKRVNAWRKHNGRTLRSDRLQFITQPFDLRRAADVADLCAAVLATGLRDGLVVIDTLNRAAPGADENASTDMGELIEACKEIQRVIGGVVLAVHHTGKDAAKGLRGHSSLFAALDAGIEVKRDGDHREWLVAKSKDDADGASNPFRLQLVDLGEDHNGEPVTSCVVEPDNSPAQGGPRAPRGATQKVVHESMQILLLASERHGEAGAPAGRQCVRKEEAVTALASDMTCEQRRRKPEARRALDALITAGHYAEFDGWVWEI
ncbi:AAA family ATPase [Paraburkholderia sp. FT54]|uniref:AAA family ATPase n=1 Tax=Paraburkholderia sp. FT54 TaxID=3074437 RepID=UPI0028773F25|nr:AAA family ATPase [Paraburkholderia sp. FT54]WNC90609.1 AAA family ATPase [Paraburkholderia sp. FT54]